MDNKLWLSDKAKAVFFARLESEPGLLDDILGRTSHGDRGEGLHNSGNMHVEEHDIPESVKKAQLKSVLPNRPPSETQVAPTDWDRSPHKRAFDRIHGTVANVIGKLEQGPPKSKMKLTLERPVTKYFWNTLTDLPDKETSILKQTFHWPGKNGKEKEQFAQLFRLMSEVFICLTAGTHITLRDLYYRAPQLFKSQEVVNTLVDDLAYTCRVSRRHLRIVAGTKGLVAGLPRTPNAKSKAVEGFELIPEQEDPGKDWDLCSINWIMVIEKESTFKALVNKGYHNNCVLGKGMLVTGKGYPDLATRAFLHDITCVWKFCPGCEHKPTYGLFDCDPHGFNIFKIYQQGSIHFSHDGSYLAPIIEFLGVKMSDVLRALQPDESFIPLTIRDRTLAKKMLQDATEGGIQNQQFKKTVIREMQIMLMVGMKCEIQLFEDRPIGLADWLDSKYLADFSSKMAGSDLSRYAESHVHCRGGHTTGRT